MDTIDKKMVYQNFTLLCVCFLLFGCCLCPRAKRIDAPKVALEESVQNKGFQRGELPLDWWRVFQDPQLTQFIEKAFQNNPTLHAARARILLAAAKAKNIRANLFPNILWGADVSSQKLSETGLVPFNLNPPPTAANTPLVFPAGFDHIPVYFTQTETEFILTYEFDLWGKNRNALKAAKGEMFAKVADMAFAQLELGIEVAKSYYELQINYRREEIAKTLVALQEEFLDLTKKRLLDNLDSRISINTIEVELTTLKQTLLTIQQDIFLKEDQLKTYLAADFTESIFAVEKVELPKIPVPENLPLHLLSNRPDISSQLWIIESAGKQIDVAKAGFYPDFNLAALFGYQTIHLSKLFEGPSVYYNVNPAVTLPFFDGGRLMANLRISEVNYDLAVFKYNELVLKATREVLDALSLISSYEKQERQAIKRFELQENLLQLMEMRVKNHLNSQLDMIKSRQNMLIAQDQEIQVLAQRIDASLSLIKALGGGFSCD